jgi:hypothetical protein
MRPETALFFCFSDMMKISVRSAHPKPFDFTQGEGGSPRGGAKVDYQRNLVSYQKVLARHIALIYPLLEGSIERA